jgi:hypothetical protein
MTATPKRLMKPTAAETLEKKIVHRAQALVSGSVTVPKPSLPWSFIADARGPYRIDSDAELPPKPGDKENCAYFLAADASFHKLGVMT